jgi:hypothetical protein
MKKAVLELPLTQRTPISSMLEEVGQLNKNEALTDDERWKRYGTLLSRFFSVAQSLMPEGVTISGWAEPTPERVQQTTKGLDVADILYIGRREHLPYFRLFLKQIIDTLPRTLRVKANHLFNFMATQIIQKRENKDPHQFGFNEKGNLILDGHVMVGTQLLDYIHHLLRRRPTKKPPPGFAIFHSLLKQLEAPAEFVRSAVHGGGDVHLKKQMEKSQEQLQKKRGLERVLPEAQAWEPWTTPLTSRRRTSSDEEYDEALDETFLASTGKAIKGERS